MLVASRSLENRRVVRDAVSFHATIVGPDGRTMTSLVVDISPLGLMARTRAALKPGDAAMVTLPVLGARAARIAWTLGGRIGAEFAEAIPAPRYADLLAHAPNDPPRWDQY